MNPSLNNMFNRGLQYLAYKQNQCCAVPVLYKTEKYTRAIRAVVGKTSQEVLSHSDVDLGSAYFDFIVEKKYLIEEPKAGHLIIQDDKVFEIVNQIDGRCYLVVDSTFEVYRIHTQLVS